MYTGRSKTIYRPTRLFIDRAMYTGRSKTVYRPSRLFIDLPISTTMLQN